MAPRKNKIHTEEVKRFYVYVFRDGESVFYVGKGSGRRLKNQERKFSLTGEILEYFDCEIKCLAAEKKYIKMLMPTENKQAGGGGARTVKRKMTKEERAYQRETARIQKIGPRRYSAMSVLSMVDERNCDDFGISKIDINRLREVANGPWC